MSPVHKLLSGSAFAFSISYLVQHLCLPRLFSPQEMGMADVFFSWVMPTALIASARYEDSFALETDTKSQQNLLYLPLYTSFGMSLLAAFLLLPTRFSSFALLFGLSVFFTALTRIMESVFTLTHQFSAINNSRMGQSLLTSLGQIGSGILGGGSWGLIVAQSAARMLSAGFYLPVLQKMRQFPRPKWTEIKALAKKWHRFPFYAMPAALLNAITNNLPFLLFPLLFSFDFIGQFGRAYKVLLLPLGLVIGAIGQVFYATAPQSYENRSLANAAQTTLLQIARYVFLPCLILGIWGEPILRFAMGTEWQSAGKMLHWIAPWLFMHALASPLTRIFDVCHAQKTDLFFSLLMLSCQSIAIWFGRHDAMLGVQLFCLSGILLRGIQLTVLFRLAYWSEAKG